MQGSVRLEKGFTFVAYILNTNNEVFGFYNGSSQYLIQREYYQPTYALGLRWSPTREIILASERFVTPHGRCAPCLQCVHRPFS